MIEDDDERLSAVPAEQSGRLSPAGRIRVLPRPQFGPPPENNLVWGILTTILCCLPLGVVSIIKASQVNSLWAQGQFDAARRAADDAKKWAIWSVVASVAVWVVIVVFYIVVLAAAVSSSSY